MGAFFLHYQMTHPEICRNPALPPQICAYKNTLGLTSIGAIIDNVAIDAVGRQGVYTFRDQSTICHRIDSPLPEDGVEPSFANVYVYDGDMDHQVDRRLSVMNGLDRTALKAQQTKLVVNNPYVRRFQTAREMTREGANLHLVIDED
ncbi:LOW QUALITY PROTEIN: Helitron helicase [Phytophthora megakarya]|uniref:Helitron helicase n=1 Tax=Phytophthora megakarya TaxID=4795 RepID=A0A225WRE4_9STRA|nr:LOW QUALITY PROTEIN: Helitron helicase [Phytophthora megakarya]